MKSGFEWYLPSWYGDIRLRVIDEAHTRVQITTLTKGELAALHALKDRSLQKGLIRKAWATERAWASMPDEAFVVGSGQTYEVTLKAPIVAIERFLTRQLRGKTNTVSVMITDQGNLYEIKMPDPDEEETNVLPFRRQGGEEVEEPDAATTVRKPAVGCPAPNFQHAIFRATDVLRKFLTPEQIQDYERHQRFVTVGARTGHRYMLTSRHVCSTRGNHFRTVYDLDEGRALCIHDWGIPAPEELLTMHVMLSLPSGENHVRALPEEADPLPIYQKAQGCIAPPPTYYGYDANGCLQRID